MKKIFTILIFCLVIALAMLLNSCGTRKVEKTIVKEETKIEQAATEKKDITSNKETDAIINDESNEIEVTPIDTSKVLIIGGKTFKNAKVKITNRKSQSAIKIKETVKDLSKKETKVVVDKKKDNKKIAIDRKSNPLWNLLWLLIPALLFFGYKILKDKLWFISLFRK